MRTDDMFLLHRHSPRHFLLTSVDSPPTVGILHRGHPPPWASCASAHHATRHVTQAAHLALNDYAQKPTTTRPMPPSIYGCQRMSTDVYGNPTELLVRPLDAYDRPWRVPDKCLQMSTASRSAQSPHNRPDPTARQAVYRCLQIRNQAQKTHHGVLWWSVLWWSGVQTVG
jgi:hypothetical protein